MTDSRALHLEVTAAGFARPGRDAQAVFRAALTALSEPGRVMRLPAELETGLPVGPAALGLLLTLADGDTPLWLDDLAIAAASYLRFHIGAPITRQTEAARFALVADAPRCPPLAAFAAGSEEYPDRSATLILEVTRLAEGGNFVLRGPGIPDRRNLTIEGLPPGFHSAWVANHALFPRGVDILLTCGDRLAGLPRSVALEQSCM
jgi:alpha-D-ribose 1-methylphosphonate 5-triphosphate synthase subunit PhnH